MPMFTKRHYTEVAKAIRKARRQDIRDLSPRRYADINAQWRRCSIKLADTFEADNPSFNRDRFMNATYGNMSY